jgi:hypothetical protein
MDIEYDIQDIIDSKYIITPIIMFILVIGFVLNAIIIFGWKNYKYDLLVWPLFHIVTLFIIFSILVIITALIIINFKISSQLKTAYQCGSQYKQLQGEIEYFPRETGEDMVQSLILRSTSTNSALSNEFHLLSNISNYSFIGFLTIYLLLLIMVNLKMQLHYNNLTTSPGNIIKSILKTNTIWITLVNIVILGSLGILLWVFITIVKNSENTLETIAGKFNYISLTTMENRTDFIQQFLKLKNIYRKTYVVIFSACIIFTIYAGIRHYKEDIFDIRYLISILLFLLFFIIIVTVYKFYYYDVILNQITYHLYVSDIKHHYLYVLLAKTPTSTRLSNYLFSNYKLFYSNPQLQESDFQKDSGSIDIFYKYILNKNGSELDGIFNSGGDKTITVLRGIMNKLRHFPDLKDAVNTYYYNSLYIFITFFVATFYISFHSIYLEYPTLVTQFTCVIILILMFIVGIYAWISKIKSV